MSGLEASEISLGEVQKDNKRFRFDSEYFRKEYLQNEFLLTKNSYGLVSNFLIDDIEKLKLPTNKNIRYLEISNVSTNIGYILEDISYNQIPSRATYILEKEDVAISNVRPCRNAVALIEDEGVIGTNGFSILRCNKQKISPYFLYAFCKTKFFIRCVLRENTATMYPAVSSDDVKNVKIPLLPKAFQHQIEKIVKAAHKQLKCAKDLYAEASNFLLLELGLKDFEASREKVSIKTLKESFLKTGRLDAEYYQAKYEEWLDKISNLRVEKLGKLARIKKSAEPGSALYRSEGVPFIRVQDLSVWGIAKPSVYLSSEYALQIGIKLGANTILFSKDGTCGIAYKVEDDIDAITSGAILHLSVKDETTLLSDYLTLLLNSQLVKLQGERDVGGSIIKHWKIEEIKDVAIPIIALAKQREISDMLQKSFKLKKEATGLLKSAIRQVEEEIEGETNKLP